MRGHIKMCVIYQVRGVFVYIWGNEKSNCESYIYK